jgi:Zn-dependent M16 (insulinase) family peptidase
MVKVQQNCGLRSPRFCYLASQLRDQTSEEMPLGAKVFRDLLVHWNYDRDPLSSLQYSKVFADLKAEILENGHNFLLELLTKRLFDSQHSTYLDMYPSKTYADQWVEVRNV